MKKAKKNKKLKKPKFKNSSDEFNFWSENDLTDFVDLSKAKKVKFVNLKD
jgi:hypothetical protein